MKSILILTLLTFSAFAGAVSKSRTYNIKGTMAEHLFDVMSAFEPVPGLEGTGDCAMGTCMTQMHNVSCTKSFANVPDKVGNVAEATLTCKIESTVEGHEPVVVSYRDVAEVSPLRRELIELVGMTKRTMDFNTVAVQSIECTAHAINRELDSLEVESTFDCKIVK